MVVVAVIVWEDVMEQLQIVAIHVVVMAAVVVIVLVAVKELQRVASKHSIKG